MNDSIRDIIMNSVSPTEAQEFVQDFLQEYGAAGFNSLTPDQLNRHLASYLMQGFIESEDDLKAYYERQVQRNLRGGSDALYDDPTRDEDEGPRYISGNAVAGQENLSSGGVQETAGERRLREQELEWLRSTGRDKEAFLLQWQGQHKYSDEEMEAIYGHLQETPREIDPSGAPVMTKGRYGSQVRIGGKFGRSLLKNDGELTSQLEKALKTILKENYNRLFPLSDERNRREKLLQAIDEGELATKEDGDIVQFVFTLADLPTDPWKSEDGRYTESKPPSTHQLASWLFYGHRPSVTFDPSRGSRWFSVSKNQWVTTHVVKGFAGRNIFELKPDQIEDVTDLLGSALVGTLYRLFQE